MFGGGEIAGEFLIALALLLDGGESGGGIGALLVDAGAFGGEVGLGGGEAAFALGKVE